MEKEALCLIVTDKFMGSGVYFKQWEYTTNRKKFPHCVIIKANNIHSWLCFPNQV